MCVVSYCPGESELQLNSVLYILSSWSGRCRWGPSLEDKDLGVGGVGGDEVQMTKATQTVVLTLQEERPVEQALRLGAGNIQDGNSVKS